VDNPIAYFQDRYGKSQVWKAHRHEPRATAPETLSSRRDSIPRAASTLASLALPCPGLC